LDAVLDVGQPSIIEQVIVPGAALPNLGSAGFDLNATALGNRLGDLRKMTDQIIVE